LRITRDGDGTKCKEKENPRFFHKVALSGLSM